MKKCAMSSRHDMSIEEQRCPLKSSEMTAERVVAERKSEAFLSLSLSSLFPSPSFLPSFLHPRSFSYLIEHRPSALGVDLVILGLDVADCLLACLLTAGHPGDS